MSISPSRMSTLQGQGILSVLFTGVSLVPGRVPDTEKELIKFCWMDACTGGWKGGQEEYSSLPWLPALRSVGCGVHGRRKGCPLSPLYRLDSITTWNSKPTQRCTWWAFTLLQTLSSAASGTFHALSCWRATYTLQSQQDHGLQTLSTGDSLYWCSAPFSRVKINTFGGITVTSNSFLKLCI